MRSIKILVLTLCAFLPTLVGNAQSGKIVGLVTDAATGEPLPGVNVSIEGTTRGAATDFDGNYILIGVRPGSYTIVASFIGFATQRKENVVVNLDLTTTVDFRLTEEVFEGEEIVVIAEKDVVQKDLTSSEARVTSDTIDRLPVTELGQVLEVQAGITNRGGLHIRGGRSSEIVYMVDGVPVTDSYDGSAAIQLENEGIQELQVVSGTFNAEYGNAMSGVINVVTKEGDTDRIGGSVKLYSGGYVVSGDGGEEALLGTNIDEFEESGIQFRDVDPYSYLPVKPGQYQNLSVSLDGPVTNRATFFVLGRYFKNDGWLYGARLFNIDGTPGDGELVPMNTFEKLSLQSNLKFSLTDRISVNLIGLGSFSSSQGYDFGRRWAPDGRGTSTDEGFDVKLKLTHLITNTTFYELNVGQFRRKAEYNLYDDPFDSRYNDFNITPPDSVMTGGGFFLRGGTDLGRFDRSTVSYLAKFDITSQLGNHHLLKAGLQAKLDNLDFTSFGLIPAVDSTGTPLSGEDFATAIPNSSSSALNSFDDVKPIGLSAYVQDKVEFDDFIVNAGVRFDYFDSRAQVPADPSDPNIFNPLKKNNQFRDLNGNGFIDTEEETDENRLTIADREAYWYGDAQAKFMVAPRLGVAYPITEAGVIHFSFGLFYQIPTLNNLFDNFGYKFPNQSGQYGPFGNPDLEPQRTTMYEIGFKQGLGDFVVDVTGYYRDVRNWVSTSTLLETVQPGVNYVVYANRDYANTRGVTVSLNRNFVSNFGFNSSYTFQVVEGSNSNPADEFFATQSNAEPTLALLPLNWDQRHKVAGAVFTGGNSWGSSIRFRFESGFPYSPTFLESAIVGNDVRPEYATNSRRMPSTYEFDLTAYKEFEIGRLRPRVFVEIFNILDRRNVVNVFSDSGEADVSIAQLQTSAFDPGFFVRPDFYSEPRRIQAGLQFKF